MAEGSLITDGMRKFIGSEQDRGVLRVEEGAIQRFAAAVGDSNPLFNDIGYAKKTRYGRLVCPPYFFFGFSVKGPRSLDVLWELMKVGAPPQLMDSGFDIEFFEPVGAGDILLYTSKLDSLNEREGKAGKLLIVTMVDTYMNQNGDVAAKVKHNIIMR